MKRRALVLLPAAGLSTLLACRSIESYVPELIAITGTIIEVAALTYKDGEYAPQVTLLMATLTPAATSMASHYIEAREEERKKAELEKLDQEIQTEYAAAETPLVPASAQSGGGLSWAAAPPAPAQSAPPAPVAPAQPAPAPVANVAASAPSEPSPWGALYASRGIDGAPALEVALLRSTAGGEASAFEDGAVLHDGRDGSAAPDALRIFFRPSHDSYVYVVAVDAAARVQPLYPLELPPAGPVPAGASVWLPGPTQSFGLDENRGLQHVFFYASGERQRDLEAQLYRFASRPKPPAGNGRVSEPTRVEGEVRARGLTGTGEAVLVGASGEPVAFPTTRFVQGPDGAPIVVTRVFEHR